MGFVPKNYCVLFDPLYMKYVAAFYRIINLLSIDVAVGAVISALFFARLLGVGVLPSGLAALGLSVWIIYTFDHLLDAWSIKSEASTARHRFHQRFFKPIALILFTGIVLDMGLVFFVRWPVLQSGLVLSGAVGIYFLLFQRLRMMKELTGSILYCCGVLLPALSLSHHGMTPSEGLVITQFSLTVLSNMILFALMDHQEDLHDSRHSVVTELGNDGARNILMGLFLTCMLLSAVQFLYFEHASVAAVVFLMNLVLMAIFFFHSNVKNRDQYRMIGDAVFFIPVIYLVS
jgi:1,4-dihydroxy-2-naphthoate octaprenyltransferase